MNNFNDINRFYRSNHQNFKGFQMALYKPNGNNYFLIKYWIVELSKISNTLDYFKNKNNVTLLEIYL